MKKEIILKIVTASELSDKDKLKHANVWHEFLCNVHLADLIQEQVIGEAYGGIRIPPSWKENEGDRLRFATHLTYEEGCRFFAVKSIVPKAEKKTSLPTHHVMWDVDERPVVMLDLFLTEEAKEKRWAQSIADILAFFGADRAIVEHCHSWTMKKDKYNRYHTMTKIDELDMDMDALMEAFPGREEQEVENLVCLTLEQINRMLAEWIEWLSKEVLTFYKKYLNKSDEEKIAEWLESLDDDEDQSWFFESTGDHVPCALLEHCSTEEGI